MNDLDFELSEDILSMSRDELLEDIKYRILVDHEMILLHAKERRILEQEKLEMITLLQRGDAAMARAMDKMREYDALIKRGTKTILMWRTNCYLLTAILVIVAIVLMIK
ncbi:uncharacterized protein YpmS [Acinetobacter lwoffii]|jgi:hypothetical protein|uniref:Uncharacterized protein YpmS n=1 Tax=Acinetobacter lwoffii TaxID=28090 RepID=A0AAW8LFI1_ACILW|nr:hypothetical protein [Acinetobacter lwoffii]MDR6628376.1 uncharacterized protein YpmS [Acinetobacter lwoffii]